MTLSILGIGIQKFRFLNVANQHISVMTFIDIYSHSSVKCTIPTQWLGNAAHELPLVW